MRDSVDDHYGRRILRSDSNELLYVSFVFLVFLRITGSDEEQPPLWVGGYFRHKLVL